MNQMVWSKISDPQQLKTLGVPILLVGCLASILWMSIGKFLNIQDSKDQIQATITLQQEVSQLRSQYLESSPETLEADLEYANRLLILNFQHLARWAQDLQQQGKQWDLDMQYQIVKEHKAILPAEGITAIPMKIHVLPQGTRGTYRAYLQFLQTLEQSGPRIDIQEVTVTGDGKQAKELVIGLSVWMKTVDSVEL